MKNIFKNVIALVILGIAIFVFRDSLKKSYFFLQDKYFPCTRVITYSIGTFDESTLEDMQTLVGAVEVKF